jgi:hypothetical protein
MADKKRSVEISVSSTINGKKEHLVLKGRFLGFILENELQAIASFDGKGGLSANKLFTGPSKSLKIVDMVADDIAGLRMCFTLREKDGEEIFEKRLFITEPLEIVNAFEPKDEGHIVHVSTESDDYIMLKETVG